MKKVKGFENCWPTWWSWPTELQKPGITHLNMAFMTAAALVQAYVFKHNITMLATYMCVLLGRSEKIKVLKNLVLSFRAVKQEQACSLTSHAKIVNIYLRTSSEGIDL